MVLLVKFRNHWVLIVLCNPSNDLKGGGERPTMLLLDSLKGSVSGKIEGFIRGYFFPSTSRLFILIVLFLCKDTLQ